MPKPRLSVVKGASPGPLDAPVWLSPAGREVWNRVAPILNSRDALTDETRDALATYCSQAGLVRELDEVLAREGATITGTDGASRAHPLVSMKVRAAGIVLQFAKRLRLLEAAGKGCSAGAKADDGFSDLDL